MQNKSIGYRTIAGEEIYETRDGEYYVLSGWDGEKYTSCYQSNWLGVRLDDKNYILTPMTALTLDDFGRVIPVGYFMDEKKELH